MTIPCTPIVNAAPAAAAPNASVAESFYAEWQTRFSPKVAAPADTPTWFDRAADELTAEIVDVRYGISNDIPGKPIIAHTAVVYKDGSGLLIVSTCGMPKKPALVLGVSVLTADRVRYVRCAFGKVEAHA